MSSEATVESLSELVQLHCRHLREYSDLSEFIATELLERLESIKRPQDVFESVGKHMQGYCYCQLTNKHHLYLI